MKRATAVRLEENWTEGVTGMQKLESVSRRKQTYILGRQKHSVYNSTPPYQSPLI